MLCEINLGATAIGTGINAPTRTTPEKVHRAPGRDHRPADRPGPNLVEATQDTRRFVLFSSALKRLAVKLSKICNDLRLLSSGPRAGFGEINLPPMQPGSSIMPGKVNPVIPEVVNQVAFEVIGNDLTVTMAAEAGQLQLNVVRAGHRRMRLRVADDVHQRREHAPACTASTASPPTRTSAATTSTTASARCTALNPVIGYDKSTELAAEAMKTGRGILEIIRERKILTEAQIATVLDPAVMTGQGK